MESLGVLERVTAATDWISSVVVETKKDGSLRVCIDPRPLNKALKRCHYSMPVVDDILPDRQDGAPSESCMQPRPA